MLFGLAPGASSAAPVAAAPAAAAPAGNVTICHRTDSDKNPYVQITPSSAGVLFGHYKEHTGPVFNPGLKAQHVMWGDIIPPFTYKGATYSLNWDAAGMAILNAGCTVGVTSSSSGSSSSGSSSSGSSSSSVPPDTDRVTLCHRTDAVKNPYVVITVDASGAYNGHYLEHQGPVFTPDLKAQHIMWGDIIPPFTFQGTTYSLNWDAAGMAIFNAGCIVEVTPSSSGSSSSGSSSSGSSSSGSSSSGTAQASGQSTGNVGGGGSGGPIPNGVEAGQHAVSSTPILVGALLMLAGAGGLLAAWRPWKRAH